VFVEVSVGVGVFAGVLFDVLVVVAVFDVLLLFSVSLSLLGNMLGIMSGDGLNGIYEDKKSVH